MWRRLSQAGWGAGDWHSQPGGSSRVFDTSGTGRPWAASGDFQRRRVASLRQRVQHPASGCSIFPAGATSPQRVQHARSGCSMLVAGAAFSQRVQHFCSGCNIFAAGATLSRRVVHRGGGGQRLRAVNLARVERVVGVCASSGVVISRGGHLLAACVPRGVDGLRATGWWQRRRAGAAGVVPAACSAGVVQAARGAAACDALVRPGRVLVGQRVGGLCTSAATRTPRARCAAQCKK